MTSPIPTIANGSARRPVESVSTDGRIGLPTRGALRRYDYRIGTDWIDTNLPSQIIRFGAYHHDVKNRDSWPGVILVFGRMS